LKAEHLTTTVQSQLSSQ